MRRRGATRFQKAVVLGALLLAATVAQAQLPENIATRSIEIWSDGTRLAADLFWPKDLPEGAKVPAIIMCGGWGSLKAHANRTAPIYAAQGYYVLTFDYRGWGESDGRLVAAREIPEPGPDGTVTVRAYEVRDLVSPVERIEDIRSAIAWLQLEPAVDGDRIGLWGTSFGGGNVVATAALDDHVKAVCSQVGDVNTRHGWIAAMQLLLSKYPKAEGTPAELEERLAAVERRLSEKAGRIEDLLQEEKLALDSWTNPSNPDGLVLVTETGATDPAVTALAEEYNENLKELYAVLANFPDRAQEVISIRAAQRARGLIDPFPQGKGFGTVPPMSGIAHAVQMSEYSALDLAGRVTCPVQIIEAGKEELMDIDNVGGALYRKLEGRVPVERHVFEDISHFEIYRPPARDRAIALQIGFFNRYLKGEAPAEETALEGVKRSIEGINQAYQAEDVDAYMQYVSDDFRSYHHFDKEGFRAFLEQAWQEMDWQSTWSFDSLKVEGDTARLTMISTSGMGTFPVPTTFKKEDDGVWRLVSQE